MPYAFISDGRLYWRNHSGSPAEIESPFAQDKLARADRHQSASGWKTKVPGSDFSAPNLWAGQASTPNSMPFRFKNIIAVAPNILYYTLANQVVTGLFRYDLQDGYETRLFHKNDCREEGFDFHPDQGFVMALYRQDGRCNLASLNKQGSHLRDLTEGDSFDTNPSFSRAAAHQVIYQSVGISRDEFTGIPIAFSPAAIMKLDLATGTIAEVLFDKKYDYMLPRQDSQGNLYCIRKPYQPAGNRHPLHVIFDIILFPFRFVVALVGFLELFTKLFGQSPLRPDGPQPQMPPRDKYVRVLGQTIQLAKVRRAAYLTREPSLVPRSWELVKFSPTGALEILAQRVAFYDLDPQGRPCFTNGFKVSRLTPTESEPLFKYNLIERIALT